MFCLSFDSETTPTAKPHSFVMQPVGASEHRPTFSGFSSPYYISIIILHGSKKRSALKKKNQMGEYLLFGFEDVASEAVAGPISGNIAKNL